MVVWRWAGQLAYLCVSGISPIRIQRIEALGGVHPDIAQAQGFQVRRIEGLGKIADQERATACAAWVQAARVQQIDIEHQDVPGGA